MCFVLVHTSLAQSVLLMGVPQSRFAPLVLSGIGDYSLNTSRA